jgi:hypothetical protein
MQTGLVVGGLEQGLGAGLAVGDLQVIDGLGTSSDSSRSERIRRQIPNSFDEVAS